MSQNKTGLYIGNNENKIISPNIISPNIIMNNTYFTKQEINEMTLKQNEQYIQYEKELNERFNVVEISNEDYDNLLNSL